MHPAELAELNSRVSEAIFLAGQTSSGTAEEREAYRLVSGIEEELARRLPSAVLEGSLARVGAVSAALRAGDWLRASRLAEEFLTDAPADLADELKTLQKQADEVARSMAEPDVRPVDFSQRRGQGSIMDLFVMDLRSSRSISWVRGRSRLGAVEGGACPSPSRTP